MEYLEMFGWVMLGFVPTLGVLEMASRRLGSTMRSFFFFFFFFFFILCTWLSYICYNGHHRTPDVAGRGLTQRTIAA